jgi:hypothetical protein
MDFWRREGGVSNWVRLLNQLEEESQCRDLRRATYAGQPFGDEEFVERLRAMREQVEHPRKKSATSAFQHKTAVAACGANQ